MAISVAVFLGAIFTRTFKFERRIYIPLGAFLSLYFLCRLAQYHIPANANFLRFVVHQVETFVAGSALGIAVVGFATGGFNHRLMKVPKEKNEAAPCEKNSTQ